MIRGNSSLSEKTYAGDLSAKQAWEKLSDDPDAVLIDVRTDAEHTWVGGPDLSQLGKEALCIQWQAYPGMDPNPDFIDQVSSEVPSKDTAILYLCRSGIRSAHAAETMTANGFSQCFNIEDGFEGARDDDSHRGNVGGWKADGLSWLQK